MTEPEKSGEAVCDCSSGPEFHTGGCSMFPTPLAPDESGGEVAEPMDYTPIGGTFNLTAEEVQRLIAAQSAEAQKFSAALWRCYELSGADTSDGPYSGWEEDAVAEVAQTRRERDRFANACDELADQMDAAAHRLRELDR